MNPSYPIYIISKGRWETRHTSKSLEIMGTPYHIVVEPQEYDNYASVIDPKKILVLPFSNLGQGSIPARNWVWEHAISTGAFRHWIMDDNIRDFYRLNRNLKLRVASGTILKCMEDFVDRYTNVAIAGPHYFMFASRKSVMPPFYLNSRVYSCILLRNDLPYRWRGRYNEDTDLSLRALKDGWCTVLFLAFLCQKLTTMTVKGGNTEELYKDDGRLKMAQSLVEQHPDVARITWKWGRWQHHVDYSGFKKNKLVLKPGISLTDSVDDYGMILKKYEGKELDELRREEVRLSADHREAIYGGKDGCGRPSDEQDSWNQVEEKQADDEKISPDRSNWEETGAAVQDQLPGLFAGD